MLGEACALAAALTWSVSVVLFKRSEAISAQGMNLFKNVVATVLLLGTLPIIGVSIDWQRSSDDWWSLALSGVLGIAIADTLVFMALRRLGAGLLAVVDCVYAPIIVGLSVALLDESLSIVFGLGAAMVVVGVLTAATDAARKQRQLEKRLDAKLRSRRDTIIGVALGVSGIAAMAVGVILAKRPLEQGDLVEVTLVRLLAGVVAQLVWIMVIPGQRSAFAAFRPSKVWRTLLPASVLGSYVAMLLWLGGFKWALASTASVLNQMSSVFTIVMARVFLSEPLSRARALGAAVAVAGALLALAGP